MLVLPQAFIGAKLREHPPRQELPMPSSVQHHPSLAYTASRCVGWLLNQPSPGDYNGDIWGASSARCWMQGQKSSWDVGARSVSSSTPSFQAGQGARTRACNCRTAPERLALGLQLLSPGEARHRGREGRRTGLLMVALFFWPFKTKQKQTKRKKEKKNVFQKWTPKCLSPLNWSQGFIEQSLE